MATLACILNALRLVRGSRCTLHREPPPIPRRSRAQRLAALSAAGATANDETAGSSPAGLGTHAHGQASGEQHGGGGVVRAQAGGQGGGATDAATGAPASDDGGVVSASAAAGAGAGIDGVVDPEAARHVGATASAPPVPTPALPATSPGARVRGVDPVASPAAGSAGADRRRQAPRQPVRAGVARAAGNLGGFCCVSPKQAHPVMPRQTVEAYVARFRRRHLHAHVRGATSAALV